MSKGTEQALTVIMISIVAVPMVVMVLYIVFAETWWQRRKRK